MLMQHIGEFKRDAIITPLVMIGEVVCEMIVPLLMATLIDNGVEKDDMQVVVRTSLIMLVVVLCGLTVGCLGSVFGSMAAAGFARNLRQDQCNAIQTFSFSNTDRFSTPSLVTRLTTDVMNIQNAFMMILRMAPRAFSSLLVAMCMVFVVSGRMAPIYLGANLIVAGDLNAGDLTSLFMYCISILMSLGMLSMTIVMITMSSASARRVVEVFTEQCDMPAAKRRSPSSRMGP